MTTRDISRYAATAIQHEALTSFTTSPLQAGLNTISYLGRTMDLLYAPPENPSDTILVSFSPAVTNPKITRPYFVGAGIFRTLNAHKLYISDPSLELNDELKLAWFAGNSEQRTLQEDLAKIIRNVVQQSGAKNIIMVGTSGGGYAALYYSLQFPKSLAYVVNPQTNLLKYHKQHVAKYAKFAWGMGYEKAVEVLPKRTVTSVVDHYAKTVGNSILWLQSITDVHHIENHMIPLLKTVPNSTDIRVLLGEDWGPGHHPAPRDLQIALLETAVGAAGDWSQLWNKFPAFAGPASILSRLESPSFSQ